MEKAIAKTHIFNRNIVYKLFAIMLLLTIIPILIFGIASYYLSARVMESDSIKNSQLSNEQILINMNNIISTLQQQSYALNMSLKDILPIVTTSPETNPNYNDVQVRVKNYMSTLLLSNKNINSIIIYNLEGYPIFYIDKSGGSLPLISSSGESWFERAIRLKGAPDLLEPHSNNTTSIVGRKTTVISIGRALVDIINSPKYETKGVLVVDSSITNFADAVATSGATPDVLNVIYSNGGNVIYSKGALSEPEYAKLFSTINKSEKSTLNMKLDNKDYLITSNPSSQFGWTAVTAIPISTLQAKSVFIKQINISLALIMVFLCLAGSVGISIWITSPLKKLMRAFVKLRNGNFEAQVEIRGQDEFSIIGLSFNMMVRNIKQLIMEKYEMTLLHRQAELEILQSQINPHFLYNTLNSITAVIKRKDYENSVEMIMSLSDIFRYSLNKGVYIVTIADELENIRKYLFLQHFRFADRFSVSYDIANDALQCPIPRLTLQPIIENAIIHGLKEAAEDGKISIIVKTYGDKCFVYISNTGNIIAPKRIEEINASLAQIHFGYTDKKANKISTGIYNVCARIKLLLGDEYGIKIMSSPEMITTVKCTLPIDIKKTIGGDVVEDSYR
ncbi:cache domain-containing sensor histidine kinase [Paenibacillus nasutitermitis]|uniref:HAMP domain-containing protein n=1 Tax=Paenibacillus nasutitermitis TaxID=1652958 RepID=A0A916ZKY4_9BACL|nr:histidine kinase [Paenibacillus nasutitermitis]GGE02083.1 hypothetical protein GCM10010911_71370 [Paenibacillus nasutitermitis]